MPVREHGGRHGSERSTKQIPGSENMKKRVC